MRTLYQNFKPFIKYCVVGVTGTIIDLAALYVLVEYSAMAVLPAVVISFLLAVTNNYLLNKVWTFRNRSRNNRKLFTKFLIVSVMGLGLTLLLMTLLVEVIGVWYMLAKAITSLIVLVWNFLANKLWTFRIKERPVIIPEKFACELSIVIPAFNEAQRIRTTLLSIHDYLDDLKITAELIVVDDGSTDQTTNVVKSYQQKIPYLKIIRVEPNRGKGFAVKTGVEASCGRYILFADADNSTPIMEYDVLKGQLVECRAQIAVGSRYLRNSQVRIKQPYYRILIGRIGNWLIRLFLIDGIKDTQCGFKLFEHHIAKEIFSFQKISRFGFDMEALVVASNLSYRIVEVPVSWFNSPESRFLPIKDSFRTLGDLIHIKLNLWCGRYDRD